MRRNRAGSGKEYGLTQSHFDRSYILTFATLADGGALVGDELPVRIAYRNANFSTPAHEPDFSPSRLRNRGIPGSLLG
jgi:hypothetical protein